MRRPSLLHKLEKVIQRKIQGQVYSKSKIQPNLHRNKSVVTGSKRHVDKEAEVRSEISKIYNRRSILLPNLGNEVETMEENVDMLKDKLKHLNPRGFGMLIQ